MKLIALLAVAVGASAADFTTEVAPIFRARCVACHTGPNAQAGLDLSTLNSTLKGGKSGHAVQPGASDRSLLVQKVTSGSMPPGGPKLSDGDINKIRAWIDSAVPTAAAVSERDALSIFQMRCVVCHGKRLQHGGLDLRTQPARLKGGKSGPALIAGKPEESLIIKRIVSGDMPPAKLQFDFSVRPPSTAEVDTLRRWIAAGAPAAPPAVDESRDELVKEKDRQFWSFQPPKRVEPPKVHNQNLVRTPVDAFLLQKLESRALTFSAPATPLMLVRRAYIAVTGMPPTPEEVDRFVSDKRRDAYQRLVEHLLQSNEYGERWGRYWLDAAGYSDSEGKVEADELRPQAWRYRDYVIRSLNADKPYDQFLREQIAGDEMVKWQGRKDVEPAELEKLVATGFWRMAPDGTYSPPQSFIPERMNVIADQMEVFGSAVLGLTIGCARCHNHKYDPLPQRDYYRLSAVLQTAYDPYDWVIPTKRHLDIALASERREIETANAPLEVEIRKIEAAQKEREKPLRGKLLEQRLSSLPEGVRADLQAVYATEEAKRTDVQKYLAEKFADTLNITTVDVAAKFTDYRPEADRVRKQLADLRAKLKPLPHVRALYEMGGEPSGAYLLRRGDALAPGEEVRPGVPAVLTAGLKPYRVPTSGEPGGPLGDSTGRRIALADWITQPNHPLTARVIVNRIWMHYFGRGIVATPANFGKTGSAPSHPELLDWLATELVRNNWSLKSIHRLILNSTAFRQTSRVAPGLETKDPDNILLSRMPMRRMDADAIYDSIRKVTGQLDPTAFGPASPIDVKPDGEVVPKSSGRGYRRALYVLQRRRTPVTMLETFDTPPMTPNCIDRPRSVVATQALQLMNSAATIEDARHLAGRILDEQPVSREAQIQLVYRRVLSRPPSQPEIARAAAALAEFEAEWKPRLSAKREPAPQRVMAQWMALGDLIHTLLNSAEFSYVD
ncbi:MAG: PSD1 domain-containing protein [Bryobacterales bacterium]|nr:PSD1 domain-containing protein [Bryobacterales bacterium]